MVNGVSKLIRKGGFNTKKEEQIAAAEIEAKLAKGILPHLKQMPFDDYFEKWMKLYKSNFTNTTKLHYDYTSRVIKEYFGGKPYLILLGLTSGARFGELVGLTRKDFDFENNTISINKNMGLCEKTS